MSKMWGMLREMDAYVSAKSAASDDEADQPPPMTLRCDECGRLTARVYPAVVDGVDCLVCRACRDASVALLEQAFERATEKAIRARREGQGA